MDNNNQAALLNYLLKRRAEEDIIINAFINGNGLQAPPILPSPFASPLWSSPEPSTSSGSSPPFDGEEVFKKVNKKVKVDEDDKVNKVNKKLNKAIKDYSSKEPSSPSKPSTSTSKPKGPTPSFILFSNFHREELKKSNIPIPKGNEFGRDCALKWAEMTEERKKPFLETSAQDRERYKSEMAVFNGSDGVKTSKSKVKDPNMPKKPLTAYLRFMADFRKEKAEEGSSTGSGGGKPAPKISMVDMAKEAGQRWNSMTTEEKAPYVEAFAEEQVRYKAALEEYNEQNGLKKVGQKKGKKSGSTGKAKRVLEEEEDSDEDAE